MKDIMKKLAELEATAPKVSKKKMLKEDSTTPPIDVSNKPASLKDVFESIAGQKPIPVVGKEGGQQQTGAGFVNVTDPALQGLGKTIGDLAAQKKIQLVVPTQPGQAPQAGQTQQPGQTQQSGQPNQAGATGQPQAGQQPMREKWGTDTKVSPSEKGKYAGKDKAELTKAYNKLKASGPHKKGSPEFGKMRELAFAIRAKSDWGKVQEEDMDEGAGAKDWHSDMEQWALNKGLKNTGGKSSLERAADRDKDWALSHRKSDTVKEEQLDELSPETLGSYMGKASRSAKTLGDKEYAAGQKVYSPGATSADAAEYRKAVSKRSGREAGMSVAANKLTGSAKVPANEGAKVDRMVKHIEKSERKLGKSKEKASDIAWATANKRGMLDNKNKKKVKEGDIAPTSGIDTKGAGLGAGRSQTTLEAKEPQVEVIDNAFNRENYKDLIGKKYPKSKAPAYARVKEISEGAKPDFLDLDKDGNKKEPMKKAAADKKKQKVKESMNHRISAARLEGKSHGLRGHAHCGKSYEDLDEMKAYHEGYIDGLNECYGQGVYETAPAMPAATVPGMASAAMPTMEDDMEEGNAFTAALAKTPKGGKFSVGGKTFTDTSSLEEGKSGIQLYVDDSQWYGVNRVDNPQKYRAMEKAQDLIRYHQHYKKDIGVVPQEPGTKYGKSGEVLTALTPEGEEILQKAHKLGYGKRIDGGLIDKAKRAVGFGETAYAFESLDQQLNALLNESEEVTEGLSVSVSKGNNHGEDSVNINATGPESEELLKLVKHAGLGLFGDEAAHEPSSAMSVQPSHGAPDEVGAGGVDVEVVDGHDGIMGLMQKLSGIQADSQHDADYEDEEGHEKCADCGEANCGCDDKEQVEEVESEDQMEFEVAEDNAPDSETAEHDADEEAEAEEDSALAKAAQQNKTTTVNEGGDGGEASEEGEEDKEGETDEEGETVSESFINLFKKLEMIAEESTEKEDEKAEKAGKKVTKDIEYDDKKDKKEKVDEWANQIGKGPGKGTDASFEQDIDFMTKVIAGGLNKPKSTGQTTIPVIAGQDDRMHDNPQDWATLAGIKK